ncbi:uncharacterized protein TNIN_162291 [Trichonephila inaurata madagascariensis]|uniref:Uncharacterized protein n=1 Tax=Trichonephila inaurata madagascariensis TaxID=2747483 RepID=A0A8X6WZQ6_9ARAC|nr:uncharacterized protein TNIN_162291 [Trichonephila inaurata madagascariensis]
MSQFNSPDSSHIFNDLEISDDDGDLNILRSSRKTYSKDRESCDSANENSFCKSTANTKNIASSSLSCENDLFIDKNIYSESIKTYENKIMNKDPLISLFDNEEDKCSASGCDFSKELLSPTFPDKTYQRTRKNLKRKVIEKELNLDEPKSKHPSINMPLKSAQTSDQQSSVSLNMSSKVKLNDTKVNIQHSPSLHEGNRKRTIVKKEIKTNASSYDRHLAQNSNNEIDMLDFVRRYSVERNLEYISRKSEVSKTPEGSKISNTKKLTCRPKSSIQKIAPKSTGAEKGCNKRKERQKSDNKSKECQKSKEYRKSDNTVVEKSTTTHKLNNGNFKQIKRPDIDKHSIQKPLQRSRDKSNSGLSVLHSSSLPSLITQSTGIHSTEYVQVAQSNTIRASHLLTKLQDLSDYLECNRAFGNVIDDLSILRHNLMSHSTVKDFFTHPVTGGVLSKLCFEQGVHSMFYKKKYPEINFEDDNFENFLNCSLPGVIEEYVRDVIHYIFLKCKNLETERISTSKIMNYAYGGINTNETIYLAQFFHGSEFLNLDAVISKLCNVGMLVIYDDFRKGNEN